MIIAQYNLVVKKEITNKIKQYIDKGAYNDLTEIIELFETMYTGI